MTVQGEQAAATWREEAFAQSWAESGSSRDLLEFPRHLAAVIIAADTPAPQTIVDVAAGAGAVLAVFLEHFPDAKGIWTDASRAMHGLAREKLAPFSDRVEYYLADMTDLGGAGLPGQRGRHHHVPGGPPAGPRGPGPLLRRRGRQAQARRVAGQPGPHRPRQPGEAAGDGRVR